MPSDEDTVLGLRMRVTSLDAWEFYKSSPTMTEQDFIEYLLGESSMPRAAAIGIAFHKAMEDFIQAANIIQLPSFEIPHRFSSSIDEDDSDRINGVQGPVNFFLNQNINLSLPIIGATPEVSGKLYLPEIDVTLTGRADLVYQDKVWDFKTSASDFTDLTIQRYTRSMQWRAYLLMFSGYEFKYLHFKIEDKQDKNNNVHVLDYNEHSVYAYESMYHDLVSNASELATFRRERGIL